jgi:hypothetical protein
MILSEGRANVKQGFFGIISKKGKRPEGFLEKPG